MYKSVHRMQSENKKDTKVLSPRPETERFGLGYSRNFAVMTLAADF
jgi:hypothetical protein